jgi:hypothetical protein
MPFKLMGALAQQEIKLESLEYAGIYALLVYLGSFSIHKTYCHKQHFLIAKYNLPSYRPNTSTL